MAERSDPEKAYLPEDDDRPIVHSGIAKQKDKEGTLAPETEEDSDTIHTRARSSIHTIEQAPIEATGDAARSKSRCSSTRSRPMSIIPRSKRRGLLGRFTIIPEVERPHEYRRSQKWLITFIVALAAAAAPMGSAIFFPSLPELSADLGASNTVTNLSVALYMLSMSIFPLWWSSFSETLGRRTIYLVSFTMFTVFAILCAVSTSIGMLIVMRILSGGAAASVQAVGAGTIADIWEPFERGKAMGIFYLGPLMGPLLAPIIGGALAQAFGWRSTQWFLAIWGGCLMVILTICLPETLTVVKTVTSPEAHTLPSHAGNKNVSAEAQLSRVTTRQSVHKHAKTLASVFKRCIIDPLLIITYLRFPAVALTVYYASITFGSLYMLNISLQQTFSAPPYSFSVLKVGLLYIPNSIGYILASLFGGKWSDKIMQREARAANRYDSAGKLILIPEDRMRENAYLASVLYPAAMVWYGWTAEKHIHWAVPVVANFFFGVGSMIIFSCSTTMLTEFMPKKSSNGVALNNFVRNIFSCVGGIVASPLIDAIGNGWLFTGLGVIALCSGSVVWFLRKCGPQWRAEMDREMNK